MGQVGDGVGERVPLGELGVQQALAIGGEVVVLARRAVARLLPGGGDEAVALQAAQEWVEGPLRGGQGVAEGGEPGGELVAVVGLTGDEGEDAQLEDAAAGLSEPVAAVDVHGQECTTRYLAAHSSRVQATLTRKWRGGG
ncbi:MAG: hypothetical protein JO057_11700, partial [Chloroflexi bacterium]|nr:hypothetical protein [Chloroflexota bacterium]